MQFGRIGAGIYGVGRAAQRNPAVRRFERNLIQRVARNLSLTASRARSFVAKNPNASMFGAGAAAQAAYSGGRALRKGSKRKRFKSGIAKGRKIPRRAGGGSPPTAPSSRVTAKYALATRMTKMKDAKKIGKAPKAPKTTSVHYKDYGRFDAEKCMWINHEHWGSYDRFWYGIAQALTKSCLARAKIRPGKMEGDAVIGPWTLFSNEKKLEANQTADNLMPEFRLNYMTEDADGTVDTDISDVIEICEAFSAKNPDEYRSFTDIAQSVKASLIARYGDSTSNDTQRRWLQSAQIVFKDSSTNALPSSVYIQNLDDAEVHVYVKSLLKMQNVTESDNASLDKHAIDSNPLQGRVYTGKGCHPNIDTDVLKAGDRTLDVFFNTLQPHGLTLLGHANNHAASDIGRIQHIPPASRLYSTGQGVKEAAIHVPVGAMKYHSTYFSMKKTFRTLVDTVSTIQPGAGQSTKAGVLETFGRHTMIGLTMEHKHGEDTIKIGYNRETDVSALIKMKPAVLTLKTNVANDEGASAVSIVPTDDTMLS